MPLSKCPGFCYNGKKDERGEGVKISYLKQKLLLTAGYLAIVAVLGYFQVSCFFVTLFGIPCPGCGMTRAVLAALRLDLGAAFGYHPMFWSMPILYLYFLLDHGLFPGKWWDRLVLITIGGGFLVNWLTKLL